MTTTVYSKTEVDSLISATGLQITDSYFQFTPVVHPQGNGPVAYGGHRLAWLDQNSFFIADVMGMTSEDGTVGAGMVLFDTTAGITSTTVVSGALTIRWTSSVSPAPFPGSSNHYDLTLTATSGETAAQFAQRFATTILSDTVLQGVKIGSQYPGLTSQINFAVTFQGASPLPITMSAPANTTGLTITYWQQPGNILDASCIWQQGRIVPGRHLVAGDNIAQHTIAGDTTQHPGGLRGYLTWNYSCMDSNESTLLARADLIMMAGAGNYQPIVCFSNGVALYDNNGTCAPLLGVGNLAVPNNLYVGGVTVGKTPPRFHVSLVSANQSITANVWNKISFDTVDTDTDSWWDATNKRYTPQIAGTYVFHGMAPVTVTTSPGGRTLFLVVCKNGSTRQDRGSVWSQTNATEASSCHTSTCYTMNGTTDYVELDVLSTATGPAVNGNAQSETTFWGYRIGS